MVWPAAAGAEPKKGRMAGGAGDERRRAAQLAALEARASGGDPIEKALAASGDEDERDD